MINTHKDMIPMNVWLTESELEEINKVLELTEGYQSPLMMIGKIIREAKLRGDFERR